MGARPGARREQVLAEWSPLALEIGRAVYLKNLVGRADLNGASGTITCFTLSTRRFGVLLQSGERLAVIARLRKGIYSFPWAPFVAKIRSFVATLEGAQSCEPPMLSILA